MCWSLLWFGTKSRRILSSCLGPFKWPKMQAYLMINNPGLYIRLRIHIYFSSITFLPLRSWGQSLPLSQISDWLLCKGEYIHDCAGLGQIALETDVLPTYSQRCHSQSPPWARQRWGWSTRHLRQGLGNIPRTKWVLGEPHVISFLNWVYFKRIGFLSCPDQTCQISISITIRIF